MRQMLEILVGIVLVVWVFLIALAISQLQKRIERLEGGNRNSQQRIDRLESANDD